MRRSIYITVLTLCAMNMFLSFPALGQQPERLRPILDRTIPRYPELAHALNLSGTVKVVVSVGPNGSVKSMRALGGNPVLLKAAEDAINSWKWAPAPQESEEIVELKFHPK